MQTQQITAIEAAFDLSSHGKSKSEKIDMLLDYISDAQSQKSKQSNELLSSFYQSEINAAKNKLKELID
jgi:hypothetical protein